MPFYKYTAKNEHGETVKGKVEAKTAQIAAAVLNNRNLLVISVIPLSEGSFSMVRALLTGVKKNDIVNITRQLATMVAAGLPLSTCLSILAEQSRPEVASLVNDILRDIEGGSSFSKALDKHQKVFSRVYIQLIRAGETGGVLDKVLNRLADNLEKQKEFKGKTGGALIYPAIVVLAMIIVGFVMMVFVVPKLTEMYTDFGAELPLPTQILIGISNFFVNFWWLIIILFGGGSVFLQNWRKTAIGEKTIDSLLFRIPIFGQLRSKVILTEFARTLSLLLGSGVSLLEGLEIVAEAIESVTYREKVIEAAKRVEKGAALSQALGVYDVFPPILFQMIAVGEETGKLDEVLFKLAVYFESESEQAVKNLTTALEPAIMIVLAVGVGLMVVAIIMPIYNLTSQF